MTRRATPAVLSVRVSPNERVLLAKAAEADVLDQRIVTIPASHWGKFEAWVHAPPRVIPALRKLSATRPAWQD